MNRKGLLAGYVVDFFAYLAFVFFIVLFFAFVAKPAGNPVEVQASQSKAIVDEALFTLGMLRTLHVDKQTVADGAAIAYRAQRDSLRSRTDDVFGRIASRSLKGGVDVDCTLTKSVRQSGLTTALCWQKEISPDVAVTCNFPDVKVPTIPGTVSDPFVAFQLQVLCT